MKAIVAARAQLVDTSGQSNVERRPKPTKCCMSQIGPDLQPFIELSYIVLPSHFMISVAVVDKEQREMTAQSQRVTMPSAVEGISRVCLLPGEGNLGVFQ